MLSPPGTPIRRTRAGEMGSMVAGSAMEERSDAPRSKRGASDDEPIDGDNGSDDPDGTTVFRDATFATFSTSGANVEELLRIDQFLLPR